MRAMVFLLMLAWSGCAARTPPAAVAKVELGPDVGPVEATSEPSGAPAPTAAPEPALVEAEAAAQAVLSLASEPLAEPRLPADAVVGVIDRAGLVAIVDAGLGRLFQHVKVTAALKGGRFVGFEITALDPHWAVSLLKAGDVITALNGQSVERPEQAMAAFERLRQADEMVVELLREGVPATLRYRIE